jgi:hypothetical protein
MSQNRHSLSGGERGAAQVDGGTGLPGRPGHPVKTLQTLSQTDQGNLHPEAEITGQDAYVIRDSIWPKCFSWESIQTHVTACKL